MTWRDRLRGLRVDLTPWRSSKDFRLLLVAGTVFYFGAMVSYVAIPFQIYRLTESNLAVGAIGIVELVPLVVFALYGGALADHVDRRRLLVGTGIAQVVLTAVLAVNAFLDEPSVALIFVVAAGLSSAGAMQRPSREALMPRTVRHDQIPAAQALTSFGMTTGTMVGPLLGGLLVAYVGIGWCFVVDIAAMLLAMPIVLFPALVEEIFHQPELLGLLYAAETVGALLATGLSGWRSRVHHHGRAIVLAAAAYGGCVALAGLMPDIWLVLVFLTLAGSADMISGIFRGTIWNQTIPETMRGRLAGIEMLSYSVGPLAGQVRAGVTADLWSVRGAFASGGAACVAGVTMAALALRGFWSYDARTDEHAQAERAARAAIQEA